MTENALIEITGGVARNPQYRLSHPLDIALLPGEQWAVVGPNGAGKNLLLGQLTGQMPLLYGGEHRSRLTADQIKSIAFDDRFGDVSAPYYYQQRWNSQDAETSPYVGELMEQASLDASPYLHRLARLFDVRTLCTRRLSQLSSGEHRKLQLLRALASRPALLVLDNPFIGLDAASRDEMNRFLQGLVEMGDTQLLLLLAQPALVPPYITHVVPVQGRTVAPKQPASLYRAQHSRPADGQPLDDEQRTLLASLAAPRAAGAEAGDTVIEMHNLVVAYGGTTLLNLPQWQVRAGERWAITGANGSGKSTLLSIVCADNPQAYASNVSLFGRRRGSGETIWSIKKQIGYLSPEMHRAFLRNLTVQSIVASGFDDTVGFYRRPTGQELQTTRGWMRLFGIESLAGRPFLHTSSGEQRLALLARAFVKSPRLLVLDEPFHGLDERRTALARSVIEQYTALSGHTLLMVSHYDDEFPPCITHRLHLQRP